MDKKADIITKLQMGKLRVSEAARILGVSRQTIYDWLEKIEGKKDSVAISQQLSRKSREVWASSQCSVMIERKILSVTKSYPEQTLAYIYKKVSRQLGSKQISWHGFYNCLKRNNLLQKGEREKFSKSASSVPEVYRERMVRKILVGRYPVAKVAREYQLSRQQVHQWLKRYQTGGVTNLKNRLARHRSSLQASENQISQVLSGVIAKPDFSYKELALYLKECDPGFGLGAHGVYNILKKYNLGVISGRRYYANKFGPAGSETPVSSRNGEAPVISATENLSPNLLPAPPPVAFNQSAPLYLNPPVLPQPAVTKSPQIGLTLVFTSIASFIGISALFNLIDTFATASSGADALGRVFALIALTTGSLFFLYSIKYYVTVALVLLFSRKINQVDSTAKDILNLHLTGSQANPLTSQTNTVYRSGLLPDLSAIELERHPFVSIHIPLFNEKRVVNRLLEAVTSMEYDNYEVVICDDSTDETKDIVAEWRNHPRIKISHRENRTGFKGQALKEGFKLIDPRTEFILVFDADFLPYQDTIQQFLKYFKLTYGSLRQEDYKKSPVAAIQGYQWHVLNKSENWITRGVRTEYAGSYVIERSGGEVYGGLKQIAGSVFMIRADVLNHYQWGASITEDFELTLKLYRDGFKVLYTPYIQAPSECVSTLKRLIGQRMRWAEGHSHNIKLLFKDVLLSQKTSPTEKFEFGYLAPYYLQSAFFLLGTFAWFVSETIFKVRLPFWTAIWGWSLVLTNLLSLPLMNTVGLFLEESEEKDYIGILSFVLLSYILAPFQAYASVKGFLEKEEGPWFRTPKTGKITDTYRRGRFYDWIKGLFGKPVGIENGQLSKLGIGKRLALVNNFNRPLRTRSSKFLRRTVLAFMLIVTISVSSLPKMVPLTYATNPSDPKWYLRDQDIGAQDTVNPSASGKSIYCITATDCKVVMRNATTNSVEFIDCDTATCSTGTNTILDGKGCVLTGCSTTDSVGTWVAIYCIATDDCKIAYTDSTNTALKFADCSNATCSTGTVKTLDGTTGCVLATCSTGDLGNFLSMYCSATNDCKITHTDGTNGDIYLFNCTAADCSSGTETLLDGNTGCVITNCSTTRFVGEGTSIYCPAANDCKIVYYDATNSSIDFIDCDNGGCTTGTKSVPDGTNCVITSCDTTHDVLNHVNIFCISATDCKLAYFVSTASALIFTDCDNATCTTGTVTTLDGTTGCSLTGCSTSSDVGRFPSIYCSATDDCKIAYFSTTANSMFFARCTTATCSSGSLKTLDGSSGCTLTNCETTTISGQYGSVFCPSSADCKVVFYRNNTSTAPGNQKFADCDAADCSSGVLITIAGNKMVNATLGSNLTTESFGTSGQVYTLVSNVPYPNGNSSGSLGSGTYTLNLRFTNSLTAGSTLTYKYEVGYCTIASDCTTKTAAITSANQTITSATTSPVLPTASTASSTTIPAPINANWIYIKISVVTAPAGGTISIRMNDTAANTADTYISIPALTVPEKLILLFPIAALAPPLLQYWRRKRKQAQIHLQLNMK